MIVPNSERKYKNFTVGLCEHSDFDGKYYEAFYRQNDSDEAETYTENNFWYSTEEAYRAVENVVDGFVVSQ